MESTILPGWDDSDIVMVSALEHYAYCPRQCALIHVEQTFTENMYTLKGRFVHELVDNESWEMEGGVRIERSLPIWSLRLGIIGKADVVEFHGDIPYPVEYKHGPRRKHHHDDLQLCAQAMCLEEMTGRQVPKGAIYHHSSHRRREVTFDSRLKQMAEETIIKIRNMQHSSVLPAPAADDRCRECSLQESCLPQVKEKGRLRMLLGELFRHEDST
ncbi:CRISPR-associated protein Cas4 [Moorella sulfitireducens (nom. illeg.)]|uniref:CRISPR-associated protein Cas4 n=1 Tax=Neomoorella sulfitireducens TaxID=2972948 RepID=UPI0021ABFBF4|nr:CRISPR-associated protein Cas4 [Moorella sulfitireducens]